MTVRNKQEKSSSFHRIRTGIFRPFQGRSGFAITILIVTVLLCAGTYSLWNRFGVLAIGRTEYLILPEHTEITEQPSWIHADVKADVFRDASWDVQRLSALDPEVTLKIKQAFELHSWVSQVLQVKKYHPARVVVKLQYRRPVAMVEVRLHEQTGLYPIDAEGIWLPPEDFYGVTKQASRFPRIVASDSLPAESAGTPWGDPRVEGAAKIAALLASQWHQAGLSKIHAFHQPGSLSPKPMFQLITLSGATISWGHSPGEESPTEALAEQKVAKLKQYISQHGHLDRSNGSLIIDLQRPLSGVTPPTKMRKTSSPIR